MVLQRIGPLSLAKIMGGIYGALGLLIGIVFAIFSMIGALGGAAAAGGDESFAVATVLAGFGVFSVVIFPILYGVMGFVGGIISGFLYNWIARTLGGLELELR